MLHTPISSTSASARPASWNGGSPGSGLGVSALLPAMCTSPRWACRCGIARRRPFETLALALAPSVVQHVMHEDVRPDCLELVNQRAIRDAQSLHLGLMLQAELTAGCPGGRLLTLEDTVEFFNLVLGVQLTPREKAALVAFMRQL